MEYQDYWKAFERTGSVTDYLHYIVSARDELAAGITEDRDERESDDPTTAPQRAAMRAVLATSAMSAGTPMIPESSLMAGTPILGGTPMAAGPALVIGYETALNAGKEREEDPNP